MYRYCVDNAVTYTPNDLALFRESPFAAWMERLTLENPDHGIPPDLGSSEPREPVQPQDDIVDTLRSEGRDVVLIDWDRDEQRRRSDTLDAMRSGIDFIINGVLALGSFCGTANMLMRTSGYSDMGDFLYVPCDTQGIAEPHGAFRLSFLADLLHSLQGQLPPQMLVIRGDADVALLQTEDHIHYYRAVKKRFTDAMSGFRKHRMPDPTESAHFGRWSECASEVMKQRAQRADYQRYEEPEEEAEPLQVAAAEGATALAANVAGGSRQPAPRAASLQVAAAAAAGAPTLAEQARMLSPGAFKSRAAPGRTPNLALAPVRDLAPPADSDGPDDTLKNLAFIGSSEAAPLFGSRRPAQTRDPAPEPPDTEPAHPAPAVKLATAEEEAEAARDEPALSSLHRIAKDDVNVVDAPAPNLRDTTPPEPVIEGYEVEVLDLESLELEPREPFLLAPESSPAQLIARRRREAQQREAQQKADADADRAALSGVDLDGAPAPRLAPVPGAEDPTEERNGPGFGAREFSSSLITNRPIDDED